MTAYDRDQSAVDNAAVEMLFPAVS